MMITKAQCRFYTEGHRISVRILDLSRVSVTPHRLRELKAFGKLRAWGGGRGQLDDWR